MMGRNSATGGPPDSNRNVVQVDARLQLDASLSYPTVRHITPWKGGGQFQTDLAGGLQSPGLASSGQHDIFRLDIAVNDSAFVGRYQRLRTLPGNVEEFVRSDGIREWRQSYSHSFLGRRSIRCARPMTPALKSYLVMR